ncbi:hypothetical protein M0P25_03825 [archaeon]|nr:hypothetical protein [archaeon]MCK9439408.1 hypothetical protein [Patescibacteria group bacterium]
MKSIMLTNIQVEDPENYSDMKVMKSNAGYYVGTWYNNPKGFKDHGTRDSQYFKNYEEAEEFLKYVENNPDEAFNLLRQFP